MGPSSGLRPHSMQERGSDTLWCRYSLFTPQSQSYSIAQADIQHRMRALPLSSITQIFVFFAWIFRVHCILGCAQPIRHLTHILLQVHPATPVTRWYTKRQKQHDLVFWLAQVRPGCLDVVFAPASVCTWCAANQKCSLSLLVGLLGRTSLYGPLMDGGVQWSGVPYSNVSSSPLWCW